MGRRLMDSSSACHGAVVKNPPKAKHVFDRFHITKLMNDKLTQLRRDVRSEVETMDRKVLKGLRWLLLKHRKNFDELKNERVRLQKSPGLNRSLALAYYLKEEEYFVLKLGSLHLAKLSLIE
jgi:transposase